jgi:putative transposase
MAKSRILLWGKLPIKRSTLPEALADLGGWPTVDATALDPERAATLRRQQQAVTMFVRQPDISLAEIRRVTTVHPEQLYRLLDRCLRTHADGRIYGFRALLPYEHLKRYERIAQVRVSEPRARGGSAGALSQLLARHPKLRQWLERQAVERYKPLRSGEMREVRKTLHRLHKQFLDQCKALGVRPDEWPFNRDGMGFRSVQAFIHERKHTATRRPAGREGEDTTGVVVAESAQATDDAPPPALLPFDAVQFDGHKLDMRLTLRFVDPFGMESFFELTRIFILVCLDAATRAVLGYHIALSSEYDSDDVACALQACFGEHRAPKLTIPGLKVREGGGFPSERFEAARYPGWRWFQYDNAKANLAASNLERLSDVVGCYVHAGRFAEPDDRAFIERFFAVLARSGLHQLPGAHGSSVGDIVRQLAALGPDLSLAMNVDELHQVVEVLLGDYNGESHGGLGGRTPLEAMGYWLSKPGVLWRNLPGAKRQELILLQEARVVTVRGTTSLYINFGDERYTSDVLRDKQHLRGKQLRIYFNLRDIRHLHAYTSDGAELGVLVAPRAWCRTAHSLRQRQEIKRLVRLGKLRYRDDEDAIAVYTAHKRREAQRSKKAATALAELVQIQSQATATRTRFFSGRDDDRWSGQIPERIGEPGEAEVGTDPQAPPELPAAPRPKPKPKVLSIKRTITF